MMARWLSTLMLSTLFFGGGCCCMRCGPAGGGGNCCMIMPCLPCLPKPIVWNGALNECGPCPGQSCAGYGSGCGCGPFSNGGLCGWLHSAWSCGRGCNGIYTDEWLSDPPDCCDPCDKCFGQFTGQQGGYCCLGPFQRLLAALHGYRYCPRPYCGPWRPIFGNCGRCGATGACGCGGAGCDSCSASVPVHGADIYYGGASVPNGMLTPKGLPVPPPETTNILEENWDAPKVKAEPGKPIHNAQQPPRGQMGRRMQPMSRPASPYSTVVGGARPASYQ
jgi:hypothetical protein